jgi:hypothetical protein
MTKFEKVKRALENKTRNGGSYISVTQTRRDGRHRYKYVIYNVVTQNLSRYSYRTLDEIIEEYNLTI